jgi:hypothetical protein
LILALFLTSPEMPKIQGAFGKTSVVFFLLPGRQLRAGLPSAAGRVDPRKTPTPARLSSPPSLSSPLSRVAPLPLVLCVCETLTELAVGRRPRRSSPSPAPASDRRAPPRRHEHPGRRNRPGTPPIDGDIPIFLVTDRTLPSSICRRPASPGLAVASFRLLVSCPSAWTPFPYPSRHVVCAP